MRHSIHTSAATVRLKNILVLGMQPLKLSGIKKSLPLVQFSHLTDVLNNFVRPSRFVAFLEHLPKYEVPVLIYD